MAASLPPCLLAPPFNDASRAHLRRLDAGWARLLRGEKPPSVLQRVGPATLPATDRDVDVVYAGGGVALLHALAMQKRGWQTLLFDRRAVGQTHREWNITRRELDALVQAGLFDWPALETVVAREYEGGFIQFHDPHGPPIHVELPHVLDLALDATALLTLARRHYEAAGGIVWEGQSFEQAWLATDGLPRVVVQLRDAQSQPQRIGAKLLVNGMGALSPLSLALAGDGLPFDGVCPTVGTVARGFAAGEVDPTVGEILLTLDGAKDERQFVWEGFPAGGDAFTTYLFYYDITAGRADNPHSLIELYVDYFERLATYKRPGPDFAHLRPVYGFIPARHHVDGPAPQQARTARGLLSVGDAAARQNPLTFTGFGSFVRHLPRATAQLDELLRNDALDAETLATLSAAQQNLAPLWVMARFLSPRGYPDSVNSILRDFARVMDEIGPKRSAAFFRDETALLDYLAIKLRMARHRPKVFGEALATLGARGLAQWGEDIVRWGATQSN
ncbi:MAG: hypothetical protein H6638_09725 [Ardenticatenales bacterium]|nr:hypothetical protein [Ardenticatenales bacterium]MCB9171876.1 hypothetical protein [Ardenticatenales bacterium]